MRHTAAFRYQFPVTAYVTPLVFQNPPAPADIQEKILATDGEVPDYYRVDIPTSITAPSDAIRIPANRSSFIFIAVFSSR